MISNEYHSDITFILSALSEPKPSQTIPPRRMGNVENFTIVCIDQDEKRYLSFLHPIVNLIRTMSDPSTLGTLLAACTYEKLIVIVSLDQGELVLAELKKHKCVQAIYFLSKQTQLPAWANDHDNITVGIHQNIELIHDHLIETLPHVSARMIPLEITPKDSNSDRPFIYCQLLKETILCEDDRINSRKDMLAFCRLHCAHNPKEIHDIEEFENSFTDTHSIGWYTRRCFLSKILSRAFRTQEIDLLFKMRYYIQCLHQQIQSIAAKESTTVYVILDVDQDTILKLQASVNGLVVFHSFLPATLDPPTLLDHQNKDTSRGIVFSIRLGPECAANIEQLRSSNCKIDVLIDIKTVFRVISIVEGETGVYAVNLESVPHDDAHFLELTDALRAETKATVIILQLTKLLLATGHYWEVDYLTELIYQDKSFEDDGQLLASLASAHHLLGNVDETKRAFKAARHQFFRSLRAFRLFLPDNHAMLSSTYNNIGSMFYHDDLHERAVKFHEMALQCQFKASSPNMKAVATYSANIGAVYIDQKKYAEAVSHLKRAALILEKTSVEDNAKGLISIFQKISNCFWSIKQPKAALEYYKKTLDIQLKLPNPLPHPLSVTYYNLSTAYSSIGDFDEAVTCAEKSIEYLKMVSNSDEELKDNQAHLEIIRQKQWLKQVLSA